MYIRATVDQWSRNSSQKKPNYICMYNNSPTTCFGRFLTGPHRVWIQCQRNYIPTINIVISVSVNTEKGGGGEIPFTKTGRVCRPVVEIHASSVPQGPAPSIQHNYLIMDTLCRHAWLHSVITQESVCGSLWTLFGTKNGLYGTWTQIINIAYE